MIDHMNPLGIFEVLNKKLCKPNIRLIFSYCLVFSCDFCNAI